MKRNSLLLLFAATCLSGTSIAQTQHCFTDEVRREMVKKDPAIEKVEQDLERQIGEKLKKINLNNIAARTTGEDTWYDIPVVVHIVHDFGVEYLSDNAIMNALKNWNIFYSKRNADTSDVIPPFKKYIGNAKIRLHLATRDPLGNPTKGITRHRSYLTFTGAEQGKLDDWSPSNYINLWFVNKMSSGNSEAAAYALPPASAASNPFGDGVIALYNYLDYDNTINHEIGHMLNLAHPWGNTNNPDVACGDDNVDDTPPTKGHNPADGCAAYKIYDTTCSVNYFKLFTDTAGVLHIIDYPDTNNSQNAMDYTYCSKMITIGQCDRMHACLEADVAKRDSLYTPWNLVRTGVLDASFDTIRSNDLKPIPDFSASPIGSFSSYMDKLGYFTFVGTAVKIANQSWNDTVTALTWTFTNGSSVTTTSSLVGFNTTFSQGGWVNLSMTATGNHTGDSTRTWDKAIYVADPTSVSATGYIQDFDPAGDIDKWPFFNYYNNEFKWQYANVGLRDGHSIMYKGFDDRINPLMGLYPYTGSPEGDVDDLFSTTLDLSGYATGTCNLNFWYSAASRSSNTADINDTLQIDYFVKGVSTTWTNLAKLGKNTLINKGSYQYDYVPTSMYDWSPKSIDLPAAARKNNVTFRFRYKPGSGESIPYSTGNNFYMDWITFSPTPASVADLTASAADFVVAPNPTQGNAYVVIKNADHVNATVQVMDITGKVVYTTSEFVNGNGSRIEIPQASISVKGIYMVQVTTGTQSTTQKLVVY